ncbi:hypothetical protein QOZ84_01915 [Romboutsia sedimentorum]|uniref:Uncharacterized protein n=1 Tax=Romboutsia sedimentorum TaxID=1368474 RepID=A0ABT7E5T5_9FIRM|nr:hypothetical protein [Romboutsia sedimentorum]MDK2562289.1 hypothetical protein [Romboutsia sedimentorum]
MKLISYVSLCFGILLIGIESIFKYNDMLGYTVTTIGLSSILVAIFLNKNIRKFFGNLFEIFF